MFYVATSRGFLASAEWKTFHQDIRSAQSFPSFAEANNAAKQLKLKGKLQHWCVLTPSPWEVQDASGESHQLMEIVPTRD